MSDTDRQLHQAGGAPGGGVGAPSAPYGVPGAARRSLDVGEITMSVHEAGPRDGAAPPVVLVHGFPELAYSWRHQLAALAGAGYRAVAPDMRGYGGTERPEPVEAYDVVRLTGDLVGLLDALGAERGVFVGHDWGGAVIWQLALLHPDRVAGVVGVNTPYRPTGATRPTDALRQLAGDGHYILRFQEPGVADARMLADVGALFRTLMRPGRPPKDLVRSLTGTASLFLDPAASAKREGEVLLDDDELELYVRTFEATGFTGGLNWYRNLDRNWSLTRGVDGRPITQPALMVTAEWDAVLTPAMAEPMRDLVDDLEITMLPRCGHWTQQECPGELNAVLLDWLTRRFPPASSAATGW